MSGILVSVDFVSTELSLLDLQRIVGCDASEGSVDRQQPGPAGRVFRQSRLRVSPDDPGIDIAQQVKSIAAKLRSMDRIEVQNDIHIALDVALFFSTAMASVEIPTASIDDLPIRPAAIAISFYPCSDDEKSTND